MFIGPVSSIFGTMMNQDSSKKDSRWAAQSLPAVYRLEVAGRLGSVWRKRLGEMHATVHESPDGSVTVLEGPIRDRSELSGILNTLNDLHLTLLRVEVVEDES